MQQDQQGNVEKAPSHHHRTHKKRSSNDHHPRTREEDEVNFDFENNSAEINPGKLDREEIDSDDPRIDNSTGHEPYEFKNYRGTNRTRKNSFLTRSGSSSTGYEKFGKKSVGGEQQAGPIKKNRATSMLWSGYAFSVTNGTKLSDARRKH